MKLLQSILVLTSSLLLLSCSKEKQEVNYVLFSGKIINIKVSTIGIHGDGNNFMKKITIDKDGTFSDTLKIESKGLFNFTLGKKRSQMYLKQGDQLHLSVDAKEFDESLKFTGIGADANNYLAKKYLIDNIGLGSKDLDFYIKLYSKEAEEYKRLISEAKQKKNNLLNTYKNLDSEFINNEKLKNHYIYLSKLNNYESAHGRYSKKPNYKVPEGFLSELKGFNFDDVTAFEVSGEYRMLSPKVFEKVSFEKAKQDSIPVGVAMIKNLEKIKTKKIKNLFIKNIAIRVSRKNKNATELYKKIMEVSDDEKFKQELTEKHQKIKAIFDRTAAGKDSPIFTNYENFNGGTTSLNDFKGKYVYIDVWATWCAPCKAEIPYLKKIEKLYHNKNIEFVSISIDTKKKHNAWKKMVKEKQLGGVQLFADKDRKSQFVIDYGIRGIPRFILIDPEGKIVDANAPKPSNPSLIEVFEKLNI